MCGAHLAALQWARAIGCPCVVLTCVRARELMEVYGTVLEGAMRFTLLEDAFHYDDIDMGLPIAKTPEAIEAVLEWLRANGCPEGESSESSDDDESRGMVIHQL